MRRWRGPALLIAVGGGMATVRAHYRCLVDGRETKGDGFCTVEGLCKSADDIRAARALRPGGTTRCWVIRNDPARSALRLATSGQVESARTRPRDPDPGNLV